MVITWQRNRCGTRKNEGLHYRYMVAQVPRSLVGDKFFSMNITMKPLPSPHPVLPRLTTEEPLRHYSPLSRLQVTDTYPIDIVPNQP
jgi:hypothetical protein